MGTSIEARVSTSTTVTTNSKILQQTSEYSRQTETEFTADASNRPDLEKAVINKKCLPRAIFFSLNVYLFTTHSESVKGTSVSRKCFRLYMPAFECCWSSDYVTSSWKTLLVTEHVGKNSCRLTRVTGVTLNDDLVIEFIHNAMGLRPRNHSRRRLVVVTDAFPFWKRWEWLKNFLFSWRRSKVKWFPAHRSKCQDSSEQLTLYLVRIRIMQ